MDLVEPVVPETAKFTQLLARVDEYIAAKRITPSPTTDDEKKPYARQAKRLSTVRRSAAYNKITAARGPAAVLALRHSRSVPQAPTATSPSISMAMAPWMV